MKSKWFFNILLYISFLFLILFLYKFNYLEIKTENINIFYLIISLLFLWAGFYLSTLSWWYILKKHNINISKRTALVSHGLSVFAKYIPGKVWVILGRAAKASGNNYSVKKLSYISLKEQMLYIWLGLLISAAPLFVYRGFDVFSAGILIIFILISFINFSDKFRISAVRVLKKIFKKEIDIPQISLKKNLKVLFYISFYWTAWIAAFYFLSKSVYPQSTVETGFIFPLGVTVGLLAVIAPGGIGVREGIMVTFMVLADIPVETATAISVISRLWFVSGELFIFLLALGYNKKKITS